MSIFVKYDPYGRMGNRMFQYAFGHILAKYKNTTLFAEPLPNFKNTHTQQKGTPGNAISLRSSFGNNYADVKILKNINMDIIVDSYLQNYNYYKDHKDELKHIFELPDIAQTPDSNELVVHIRETDYRILKANINKEYYYNTISKLNYDKITIITDDINCETVVYLKSKGYNILSNQVIDKFVTHNDDNIMKDFIYMLKAKHLFIAQSTFSWWSAFLGNHDKIYAPVTNVGFWKDNPGKDDINLYMDHFIKVKE